jgi:PAS domain S-box-containing protein
MNKPTVNSNLSSLQADHEEALAELELYKLLVDSVQDYAIFYMDTEGFIKTWNKGAQKAKGYTASEIVGRHFSVFYPLKDIEKNKPQRELEIARKNGRVEDEGWRIRKDGTRFWANVVITALYDNNKELVGFAKVTRDLTQRKEDEDKLRNSNIALKQQQQELQALNTSKDDFISLASHQLRTPATGVKQYIGMLIEGFSGALEANQQALLTKAYESNERQLRIISDLLKVAQVDAGKIKPLKTKSDIGKMVASIINEQGDVFAHRHQTIDLSQTEPNLIATVDGNLIRMVLENIINNASKYSHEHTAIEVRLSGNDTTICVEVKDHGVGILEADIPRLFEKFSRIDNDLSTHVGGSGLGLYWAKKIVDLHNGTIVMQSQHGEGTTFKIDLPR